jgi:hypothetical protein
MSSFGIYIRSEGRLFLFTFVLNQGVRVKRVESQWKLQPRSNGLGF